MRPPCQGSKANNDVIMCSCRGGFESSATKHPRQINLSLIIDQLDINCFIIGYPPAARYLQVCMCVVCDSKAKQQ